MDEVERLVVGDPGGQLGLPLAPHRRPADVRQLQARRVNRLDGALEQPEPGGARRARSTTRTGVACRGRCRAGERRPRPVARSARRGRARRSRASPRGTLRRPAARAPRRRDLGRIGAHRRRGADVLERLDDAAQVAHAVVGDGYPGAGGAHGRHVRRRAARPHGRRTYLMTFFTALSAGFALPLLVTRPAPGHHRQASCPAWKSFQV